MSMASPAPHAPVTCRPPLPTEAALLAALHHAIFATHGEPSWDAATFASLLADPLLVALLVVGYPEEKPEEGDPVPLGMILCQSVLDESEVLTVGVVPSARGRGLGGLLLEQACGLLRQQQVERLLLEVAEDNLSARALYASHQFHPVGRRKGYYPARSSGTPARDALVLLRLLGTGEVNGNGEGAA